MKKLLLICSLLITSYSYGQIVNKKVQRIAKKNVEIFLSPKFDKTAKVIVDIEKGTRKVEDKSQGIANYVTTAFIQLGVDVINEGAGNSIVFTIKWAALDELKRMSGTIFDSNSNVVGTIEYNGPYIPNSHKNIATAIAYKFVQATQMRN